MALAPGGARNKGATAEREGADLLMGWAWEVGYQIDPCRNLEQVRSGGYDLNGVHGLGIEVKRVETLSVSTWWKQATRQADADGSIPFLMYRQNRKKWQFRVRMTAAFYATEASGVVILDADLDYDEAKKWFQYYIWINKGHLRPRPQSTPLAVPLLGGVGAGTSDPRGVDGEN